MTGQFQGKVALITGAGSGIGRAASLMFAKDGAKVVVSDISAEGGQETVRKIVQEGGESIFVKADVTKAAEVEALLKKAIETYGRLDYAYNNAGAGMPIIPIPECTEEFFDSQIALNLKGIFLCMKYELPYMLKNGGGAIINAASHCGVRGVPGRAAYVASKHGVVGLTKSAALDYAKSGIRINAIAAHGTKTNFQRAASAVTGLTEAEFKEQSQKAAEHMAQVIPMGRMAEPEEIAEAVIWLCSNKSSYVTGEVIVLCAGATAS
jgi:NAD(P)-dependent dehydrogenase (short-subunit alcohol dehydrogenase family)